VSVRARAGALRRRHPAVDFVFACLARDSDVASGLLGAALGFRIFLWLLPAGLVIVGGLGFTASKEAGDKATSLGFGVVADQVREASADARGGRGALLLGGLVLLVIASAALVKATVIASALAWGLPRRRPGSWPGAVGVLIAVVLSAVLVGSVVAWLRHRGGPLGLGALLATVFFWVALWWGVSMLLPHAPGVRSHSLLPGALVFGLGIFALHVFSVLYLDRHLANQADLYGAIGGAATLLLWTYLLGRLVVLSAVVNATWADRDREPVAA
jgi:uncharacterized BrkB/YihY/UPF0761 family membrane protein